MLEFTLDKLPGGDATRRQSLARITLTNTGQGAGGVKTYEVRVTHLATDRATELTVHACRTYRDDHEGALRLVHRALGRLLGERGRSAQPDRPQDAG
jgi:hypothetical protein